MAKRKNTKSKIEIAFWGVRGSIATHHPKNLRYGGHTACISIHFQNQWLVCDAGTGIRLLGQKLAKEKSPVAIFISHLHWDHIFGLPFFLPLYQHKRKVLLAGPGSHGRSFRTLLGNIMRSPYFPIGPVSWNSHVQWLDLGKRAFSLGDIIVETYSVNHPDKALGFKFLFPQGKRVIYVTDQELKRNNYAFAKWIEGADLLIHDAQYDREEYAKHKGWGHSAHETVLDMAKRAKVKKLVLFHHDPNADDAVLAKRLSSCRKNLLRQKSAMKCFMAKEGMSISI